MKKKKLNSTNPIYQNKDLKKENIIEKKVHICDAPIRDSSKKLTGKTSAVYAIYYKS